MQKLAIAGADWSNIPFALLEPHDVINAFRNSLLETGVLYRPEGIEDVFERNSLDVTICLMSMLPRYALQNRISRFIQRLLR